MGGEVITIPFLIFIVRRQLTSDELTLEWYRVENSEAFLGANCEAILVLVEADILYAFWTWCFVYHFTNNYYNSLYFFLT